MKPQDRKRWYQIGVLAGSLLVEGAIACFILLFTDGAAAQRRPIADNTLGGESTVVVPDQEIRGVLSDRIEGGARRGSNLFHSFSEFGIDAGRGAYFAPEQVVENIFSRVTGDNASEIFGRLGVLSDANLFFLNPNGIIFGPDASLDIRGSFVASTSDRFTFPDGSEFSARNPQAPPLLTVSVPTGLQYGANLEGDISSQGNLSAGQNLTLAANRLDLQGQLQSGQSLTLLAQNIVQIRNGSISPFLAQSGQNLIIQGNQGIDIWALNSSQSAFQSGGHLSLISDGLIATDAHFESGGDFDIRTLSGAVGNFVSYLDPVFLIGGDYTIGDYTGVSLQVDAVGDISYGNVVITGVDPVVHPTNPALFLTAGGAIVGTGDVSTTAPGGQLLINFQARRNIDIQEIAAQGGSVSLTSLEGAITTNGRELDTTNGSGRGGNITLSAGRDIGIGDISSFSCSGFGVLCPDAPPSNSVNDGGMISITSVDRDITVGNVSSFSGIRVRPGSASASDGGSITLYAPNGNITTNSLRSDSFAFSNSGSASSGDGGSITLEALGNIVITANVSADSDASAFTRAAPVAAYSGRGGDLVLITLNGDIQAESLFSGSSASASDGFWASAGDGGYVSLSAFNGSIRTRGINSSSSASSSSEADSSSFSNNGGNVILRALNGNVVTGSIRSSSEANGDTFAQTRQGGAITLLASDNIDVDVLRSVSYSFGSTFSDSISFAGDGGAITLTALTGSITARSLSSYSLAIADSDVTLIEGPPIYLEFSTTDIDAFSGDAGAVILDAPNGVINNAIRVSGEVQIAPNELPDIFTFSTEGQGGNIDINVKDDLVLNRINTTGSSGGGNITLTSSGAVSSAEGVVVTSDTFGAGRGGDIQITARSIFLDQGAQLSASSHNQGRGGNIVLTASEFVDISGLLAYESLPGPVFPSSATGLPADAYLGGYIPTGNITQFVDIQNAQYPSGVFSQTTTDSTGDAGSITVNAQRLFVRNQGAIATTTFGEGNAGNVNLNVPEIVVDGGSILSGVAGGSFGDSGSIDIQTRSLTLTNGGVVQTQTLGNGDAGPIRITAIDEISLLGRNSGLRSGSGGDNELLGTIGDRIGRGGNIQISTGNLSIMDEAALDAQTQSGSRGGDIIVNANRLEASRGGRVITTTNADGGAGDIVIRASELDLTGSSSGLFAQTIGSGNAGNLRLESQESNTSFSVNLQNGAQISASSSGTGEGGSLSLIAPDSITIRGDGFLSAQALDEGLAGDLSIQTGQLAVQDQTQITVSSIGEIPAGDLQINANQVLLDGRAILSAETIAGTGGNIQFQVEDLLRLDDNSEVSASTQSGEGGSLTIIADRDTGSLVQVNNGSRLSSQANDSNGIAGGMEITADQLYVLNGSEILVSSQQGAAGNVSIFANQVRLSNQSLLSAETVSGARGNINLQISDSLQLHNESIISASTQNSQGGSIVLNGGRIAANQVNLMNGSRISAESTEDGDAGQISLNTRQLRLRSQSAVSITTVSGQGGDVSLLGLETLEVVNGEISAATATGTAGSIAITATDSVRLSGEGGLLVEAGRDGTAGSLTINTGRLTLAAG
ncbi:MAG: filamentous hemagglutinin N-terminal domain-containing protein, partial [Elainellaceae cyanobacterium]